MRITCCNVNAVERCASAGCLVNIVILNSCCICNAVQEYSIISKVINVVSFSRSASSYRNGIGACVAVNGCIWNSCCTWRSLRISQIATLNGEAVGTATHYNCSLRCTRSIGFQNAIPDVIGSCSIQYLNGSETTGCSCMCVHNSQVLTTATETPVKGYSCSSVQTNHSLG